MARPQVSLAEAVEQFIQVRSDLSPKTARQYQMALRLFIRTAGPGLNVRSLSARHCEEHFITGDLCRKKMLAASSFNKERLLVQQFIHFCATRGWVNPMMMDNVRPLKQAPRRQLRLSPEELMFCLNDQKHPRDRMIVALGLNTALRASEIASLQIKDVDLDQGWLYTTLHKNNKMDVFPINSDLDAELRRWLTWYTQKQGGLAEHFFLVPSKVRNGIVTHADGRKPTIALDPNADVRPLSSCIHHIQRPVQRSLAALGYASHREGLHTLRRSVARVFYDKIVADGEDDPLRVTQQLLNHSSALTTEHYLGVEPERRKRDESLRGKPFLSSLLQGDNVVRLKEANGNSAHQGNEV